MPIFVVMFIVLFIVVPYLLTKMAADLLNVRTRKAWILLFLAITALNWEMWQTPRAPSPVREVAARQASVP